MDRLWHSMYFDEPYRKLPAVLGALIILLFLVTIFGTQGYLSVFSPLLAAVYVALGLTSLYYSHLRSAGWNFSILTGSVIIGGLMEFIG
jgi:hypothetical protein